MQDRREQRRLRHLERGRDVRGRPGAAGRDHRHRDRAGDGRGEVEVVARLRPVRVDRRQQDLARAALLRLARPVDGVARRRVVAGAAKTSPPPVSIATTTACDPSSSASSVTSSGRASAAELTETLSAPARAAPRRRPRRTPPPTVNGIETASATRPTRSSSSARSSSVALTSRKTSSSAPASEYARGELDRVADVAQPLELDALDDAAAGHVEARDQARERHRSEEARARRAALLGVELDAEERAALGRATTPSDVAVAAGVSAAYECAK